MGVKNWGDIIPYKWVNSCEVSPGAIAIDVPNYLSRRISVIRYKKDNNGSMPLTHVGIFLSLVKVCLGNHVLPVFVFDGPPETMKRQPNPDLVLQASDLYSSFKQERDPYNEEIADELWKSSALRLYFAVEHMKDLCHIVGVPSRTSPSEAEMFAAILCRDGIVQSVVSNDADSLLFGAPHVSKQMQLSSGKILRATLRAFQESLQLDLSQLRDLAILNGCDFHEGVKGIGPRRGSLLLQKYGDLEGVLKSKGFVVGERAEYLEAREVFEEASYLSSDSSEMKLNPPLVHKMQRSLEIVMSADKAESVTQQIVKLWRSFGNRQATLEQWL